MSIAVTIPLSFVFWLALSLQQSSALLVEKLRAALGWIRESGDALATFRVMTWLATACGEARQLHQAHRECLAALTLLEQISGGTPVAGYLLFCLFNICYAWNRLEEAWDVLRRLLRIAQDWQQFEREKFANNVRWIEETRVWLWLARGSLTEAGAWAAQTTLSPRAWDPLRKWEVLLLARIALAQRQPARAVETLERFSWHRDQPGMALYVVALFHAGRVGQARTVATRLLRLPRFSMRPAHRRVSMAPLSRKAQQEVIDFPILHPADLASSLDGKKAAKTPVSRLVALAVTETQAEFRVSQRDHRMTPCLSPYCSFEFCQNIGEFVRQNLLAPVIAYILVPA